MQGDTYGGPECQFTSPTSITVSIQFSTDANAERFTNMFKTQMGVLFVQLLGIQCGSSVTVRAMHIAHVCACVHTCMCLCM